MTLAPTRRSLDDVFLMVGRRGSCSFPIRPYSRSSTLLLSSATCVHACNITFSRSPRLRPLAVHSSACSRPPVRSLPLVLPSSLAKIVLFPKTIGMAIPQKATFFITYVMVDGWAGVAGEILRLKPLIVYHLKNIFLVKTEKDREEAMDPGSIEFNANEPKIQLYFLLGLVYAVVTPFLLPYIMVFFGLAYLVFRHQIINVYNQQYESAAAFWPNVHGRVIIAMVVSQVVLLGLLSTKEAAKSTPILIPLPVLTIWFHNFCKSRFESAFRKYPLQEAKMKDILERTREPNLDLKGYLLNSYVHPVFKEVEDYEDVCVFNEEDYENVLVPTKRTSRKTTPAPSKCTASSTSSLLDVHDENHF